MEKQPEPTAQPTAEALESSYESALPKKVIAMTEAEFEQLDAMGPDNETVQQWLKTNNITEGEDVVIRMPDLREFVVGTDPNDFLTSSREKTRLWHEAQAAHHATEAARSLVAIESGVDAHSQEIAETSKEREPVLITEEEVRELGEEGLESSGVEDPEEEKEEVPEQREQEEPEEAKRAREVLYERRIGDLAEETASELRRTLGMLEESSQYIQRAERAVIDGANDTLTRLLRVVMSGDYPQDAIRTTVRQTMDDLYISRREAIRLGEDVIGEAKSATKRISAIFEQKRGFAEKQDADFKALSQSEWEEADERRTATGVIDKAMSLATDDGLFDTALEGLQKELSVLAQSDIRRVVEHMNAIVENSYRGPMAVDELRDVAMSLQRRLQSDELHRTIGTATRAYEPKMQHMVAAISSLANEAR